MKKIFAIILTVMLFGSMAHAADMNLWRNSTLNQILKRGELRVGLEAGYMPFEMRSKNGQIIGFDVDIAKAMAKAMGVKLKLVNTAWDGIIPALLTNKFDIIMSGMTITQQRNLKINFANPYVVVGQAILLSKKLEGKVKSYKDLNSPKYTIVTKLGVTGEFATKKYIPKAHLQTFETEPEAVMQVINGKADAFVYDQPYCAVFYAKKGIGKLVFLDKPFTYEPLAWGVQKGDPDFLNWLNNFLRQIKHNGTYSKTYKKWFLGNTWLKEVQ